MADEPPRSAGAAQIDDDAIAAGAAVDPGPDPEYGALGERIGALIEALEEHPDRAVGAQLDELLIAFDRLHRDALRRLAGLLAHHELLGHAFADPVVAMVLDLYDLGAAAETPGADAQPAAAAAAAPPPAAPQLIRLQDMRRFPAATMPASAAPPATGPKMLERVLSDPAPAAAEPPARAPAAPARPTVAPAAPAPPRPAPPATDDSGAVVPEAGPPRWTALFTADNVPPGGLAASADGEVLICNAGGALHALRNRCGGSPLPLHFGEIVEEHVVCPWHKRCDYDPATGESTSGRRTVVYPVRVEDGRIVVALNHGRSTGPLQPSTLRAAPM